MVKTSNDYIITVFTKSNNKNNNTEEEIKAKHNVQNLNSKEKQVIKKTEKLKINKSP